MASSTADRAMMRVRRLETRVAALESQLADRGEVIEGPATTDWGVKIISRVDELEKALSDVIRDADAYFRFSHGENCPWHSVLRAKRALGNDDAGHK